MQKGCLFTSADLWNNSESDRMDMNNPIVIFVILGIIFVAIFMVLFAINQAIRSDSHRHRSIQTMKKQPRCLSVFKTRF